MKEFCFPETTFNTACTVYTNSHGPPTPGTSPGSNKCLLLLHSHSFTHNTGQKTHPHSMVQRPDAHTHITHSKQGQQYKLYYTDGHVHTQSNVTCYNANIMTVTLHVLDFSGLFQWQTKSCNGKAT